MCASCGAIRDRIALGTSAYTALRLGGDSASQLLLLESKLMELDRLLETHRCEPAAGAEATRGK